MADRAQAESAAHEPLPEQAERTARKSLWRHRDFLLSGSGQTVSGIGEQ